MSESIFPPESYLAPEQLVDAALAGLDTGEFITIPSMLDEQAWTALEATGWAWNEEGTELTFPLRQGIKWHDGKPFTAADVKCTIDLLQGTGSEKLRINPRKTW